MNQRIKEKLNKLLQIYRKTLLENIIPWWIRYALDQSGALNTCISDTGKILSKDRWGWSQWRAVWVFSKLYNSIEKRQEWLEIALNIYLFMVRHGQLSDGHWATLINEMGNIERGYDSIYVDGFAIYALAELYRAKGKQEILDLAIHSFNAAEQGLNQIKPPPAWPYPIPDGQMNHGISMLFSLAYHELALVSNQRSVQEASLRHHRYVMDRFYRPNRKLILEWLDLHGNEIDPPRGTVCVIGHAIESMWIQLHIARAEENYVTINKAIDIIQAHLTRGWDTNYGGLYLAIDAENRSVVDWAHHNTKLWWPHTEALYATLLAYSISQKDWILKWHSRIHKWSYAHFPHAEAGEWRQKLTREGREITESLVLPVKDPFHLPRALIYCIEIIEKLLKEKVRL